MIFSNLKHKKCISGKVIANLTLNHFLHLLCCLPRSHFSDLSVLHLLKACFTTIFGPAMIHCPCILKWYSLLFKGYTFTSNATFVPLKVGWLKMSLMVFCCFEGSTFLQGSPVITRAVGLSGFP